MSSTAVFSGDIISPFSKSRIFNTLVTAFDSGKEQRRSKWTRPKHRFKWGCTGRGLDHSDYIYDFFNSRQGSFESFYWEAEDESPTSISGDEPVGTGNGSTTAFQFNKYPVKSGDCAVTVGGVLKTEGSDYTVNYTTGALLFGSAPTSGDAIVATGYRWYYKVRFEEDEMNREQFMYRLYNFDINLLEVF